MALNRRQFIQASGLLGLSSSLPLIGGGSALKSHFRPKAKRMVFVFLTGGMSHIESFDPKPALVKLHNKPSKKGSKNLYKQGLYPHKPYGQAGIEATDIFPHLGSTLDEMTVIRSMSSNDGDHFQAVLKMHSGSPTIPMPGIGSWLSYGLGSMNPNLPNNMVICSRLPYAGGQNWSSSFLPANHQGLRVLPGNNPIPNLKSPVAEKSLKELEAELLKKINADHLSKRDEDDLLKARMKSFETAKAMMKACPEVFDFKDESAHIKKLYGYKDGATSSFAWQCMVARRLIERDVRFVEVVHTGANRNWDNHSDTHKHAGLAREVDQPVSALINDLKQRGLLDETIVVLCTEFGRTPHDNVGLKKHGRGHHPRAFTCLVAGGGFKKGYVHGATNDTGETVIKDKVSIHDFHATLLNQMGLDHEQLTYRYADRDFRLTDVYGKVITDIIS